MAFLAEQVRERRERLGLKQVEVHERGGPNTATLREIEGTKKKRYSPDTYRRLDIALELRTGSALDTAMAGIPFRPLEEPEPRPRYEDTSEDWIASTPGLSPKMAQTLVGMYRALRDAEQGNEKTS